MSLVEHLQAFLTQLRARRVAFTLPSSEELAHLRQHLRARFEEFLPEADLEQQEFLAGELQDRLQHLEAVAVQICWHLEPLAIHESERLDTLCAAIDFDLPEEMRSRLPRTSKAIALWRDPLSHLALQARTRAYRRTNDWTQVRTLLRYAAELKLTRQTGNAIEIAPMGEVLLRLIGRDAVRWLLAAEVTQSLGPGDPWRMSRELAANLASMEPVSIIDPERPCSEETLERCIDLQLIWLVYEDPYDALSGFHEITPLGRELLMEAGSQETPFTLLAQALSADQTQAVLAPSAQTSLDTAAKATVRHTRMVAHEIRNALVPVRVAVKQLWRDLSQNGQDGLTAEHRATIDGNIERIFKFVDESVRLTRLASEPPQIFDVLPAIRDAVSTLDPPPQRQVELTLGYGAAALRVRGHRPQLVLALTNLLRNAVQVKGPDVSIEIQVSALPKEGRFQIAIDDDGPGIPAEQRVSIFQNGVSHRSDGTGHGLTLVREVIEREMSGKITCEESQRGGARFVIELPWA
jgi:signal transduction histidine kinase